MHESINAEHGHIQEATECEIRSMDFDQVYTDGINRTRQAVGWDVSH
jgi:hypothetical protein